MEISTHRKIFLLICALILIVILDLYTVVIVQKLNTYAIEETEIPTTTESAHNIFHQGKIQGFLESELENIRAKRNMNPKVEETEAVIEENEIYSYRLDLPISYEIQDYLYKRCEEEGIEYSLALAIIECESDFTVDSIGATNDYGLFQINGSNYYYLQRDLGIDNLLDPYQNIDCGLYMLKQYWTEDIHHTLMCYNAGASVGNYWWETGTTSTYYTERVMEKKQYWEEQIEQNGIRIS